MIVYVRPFAVTSLHSFTFQTLSDNVRRRRRALCKDRNTSAFASSFVHATNSKSLAKFAGTSAFQPFGGEFTSSTLLRSHDDNKTGRRCVDAISLQFQRAWRHQKPATAIGERLILSCAERELGKTDVCERHILRVGCFCAATKFSPRFHAGEVCLKRARMRKFNLSRLHSCYTCWR